MEALMSYDWPGNVRELQNCRERRIAMSSGPLLHIRDLPSALQTHRSANDAGALSGAISGAEPLRSPAQSGIIPLTEMEKRAIVDALAYTKGDRVTVAFLLGIGRTTLYRKLKEYRLVS